MADEQTPIELATAHLRRKIPSILPPVAEFVARKAFESIDVDGLARAQTAHQRRDGVRSWPIPCMCGEPHWTALHQAEAAKAHLLGGAS